MEIYKIEENRIVITDFKTMKKNEDSKYWIIATPHELANMNDYFMFNDSTLKECLNLKQHARLEVYDSFSFGVLNSIEMSGAYFIVNELNFYITKSFLIFVHKEDSKLLHKVIKEIEKGFQLSSNYTVSISKIVFVLLDKLTSTDNIILHKLESRIAALEEQVMEGIKKDFIKEIISLRKQLLYLKRYYEPLMDIVEDLEENDNNLIDENSLKYFRILTNRVHRLNTNVLNLRDYVTQVREAYQAQVDINLNKIMKVFTVITATFLPLTLIAGWYGMNFKVMPELDWRYGYVYVIALSVVVAIISLAYFKRHKYLD